MNYWLLFGAWVGIGVFVGSCGNKRSSISADQDQPFIVQEPAYDSAVVVSVPFNLESMVALSTKEFTRVFAKDLRSTRVQNPLPIVERWKKFNRPDRKPKRSPDVRCLIILYRNNVADTIGLGAWAIVHDGVPYYNDSLISYIRHDVLKGMK